MATNPSTYIRMQALASLQQQFFEQMGNGGGLSSSLVESLLMPHKPTQREVSAKALTGRIRADAGMLSQASLNAAEGESISQISFDATKFIADSLGKMKTIAQSVSDGSAPITGELQTSYNNLAQGIANRITSASYNGISLLNRPGWTNDQRLSIAPDQKTATLSLQMGNASQTLTLRDLSSMNADVSAASIASQADATSAVVGLSALIRNVEGLRDGYKAQASGYASEAASLSRQSDILSTAAKRAEGTERLPSALLLDMLMSGQGSIFRGES